jgi:deoxyribodipyrimidine photo-lyase
LDLVKKGSGALVEPERLSELNDAPERPGAYVLYWMQQSQRAVFNPALEVAIGAANRLGLPLLVAFGLHDGLPHAKARHYAFMLEGLVETATALRERGIAFVVRRGSPDAVILQLAAEASLIVCDAGYLRAQQRWRQRVAARAGRRVLMVEGDVVVPARLASAKQEIGARSLRPKLARWRDRFLVPLRRQRPLIRAQRLKIHSDSVLDSVPELLAGLNIDHSVAPVAAFRGGHAHARRCLREFVAQRLGRYRAARALPAQAQVSRLSPYLHFGQISPVEIALAVRDAAAPAAERDSFLEELIVRRELAVNYVITTPRYDLFEALPEWAQRSLNLHARDLRPHLYSYEQLAAGRTHDPYWNAAMRQMRLTGFMHNYMRMYWGKKVLEWSATPQQAHATLLRLNNSYFLDGRDANSYANVGWIFGLHDRPWPQRPIFGNVRSMSAAGLERKTDIQAYLQTWGAAGG